MTSFTIHSIIIILENKKRLNELRIFINSLPDLGNIIFYYPGFKEEQEIVNKWTELNLDFDDAFQYYVAKKMNAEIITFDKDFRKVKDVPVQIL